MGLLVDQEDRPIAEALPTLRTSIGSLPSVDPRVDEEVGPLVEALPTVRTTVGSLVGVVGDEVGAAPKALPTLRTLIGLLTGVDLHMGGQGWSTGKTSPTLPTDIISSNGTNWPHSVPHPTTPHPLLHPFPSPTLSHPGFSSACLHPLAISVLLTIHGPVTCKDRRADVGSQCPTKPLHVPNG